MSQGDIVIKKFKAIMDIESKERLGKAATLLVGTTKRSGIRVAAVLRPAAQAYRGKCATIGEAKEVRLMSWMLEATMIPHLADFRDIKYVLTIEKECGDIWISHMRDWSDPEKLLSHDDGVISTDYRGILLRHLPIFHMLQYKAESQLLVGSKRSKSK